MERRRQLRLRWMECNNTEGGAQRKEGVCSASRHFLFASTIFSILGVFRAKEKGVWVLVDKKGQAGIINDDTRRALYEYQL